MAAPGTGCHQAILGTATLGIMAGEDPAAILRAIADAIPLGARSIPAREIQEAITRALSDTQPLDGTAVHRTYTPRKPQPTIDGPAALARIIAGAGHYEEVDIWDSSPIRLHDIPANDAIPFMETMYLPGDLLFIGERQQAGILGQTIRTRDEWISFFQDGGVVPPLLLCNPLTGQPAARKDGVKMSLRADANVQSFRHCIVEFDSISIEDQIKFWAAVPLPVKALVDSGNKSIHAWIDIADWNITDQDGWQKTIRQNLYERTLIPMGVDGACANPARLSRMPGRKRTKTGRWQRLLWLSAGGQEIGKRSRKHAPGF